MTLAMSLLDVPPGMLERDDLTVADVAHLPEDLRYELIDGRLYLSPTSVPFHSVLIHLIGNALYVGMPDDCVVTGEQSVMIDDRTELVPDATVIDAHGADRTPVFAAHLLLAVEVISPDSITRDRSYKRKRYADAGIPSYWIFDPLGQRVTFTQYLLGDDGIYEQHMSGDELVTVDVPWEVTLDLPAWTRRRDRIREAARSRR